MDRFADPAALSVAFFAVAAIYASVGLGGGSAYTALLALAGVGHLAIPAVSLSLNLIVTTAGFVNYFRSGHARAGLVLPFVLSSVPMAFVGGRIVLPKSAFHLLLLLSLLFVAVRIYWPGETAFRFRPDPMSRLLVSVAAGGLLGLVAGIVGIGGGVYLVPLIIVLGLGTPKEAAACGTVFVWLNSASGLLARLHAQPVFLGPYLPLAVAVLVGGLVGSSLGARWVAPRTVERLLGLLIVLALFSLSKKLLPLLA